jgi:hypothetical protein
MYTENSFLFSVDEALFQIQGKLDWLWDAMGQQLTKPDVVITAFSLCLFSFKICCCLSLLFKDSVQIIYEDGRLVGCCAM